MLLPSQLIQLIQHQNLQPVSPGINLLCQALLARFGSATQAILFYGSCLRSGNDLDGLVDLYVVVNDYRKAYNKQLLRLCNQLLPPNVFYLEVSSAERTIHAKYAVISLRDLQHGTARKWFHSYLWGRFAQPIRVLYVQDEFLKKQIDAVLAQAVVTFMTRVLPRLPARFEARELWLTGLSLSYRAELRAEKSNRVSQLWEAAQPYYEQITQAAMPALPYNVHIDSSSQPVSYATKIAATTRFVNQLTWHMRQIQGKTLSLVRLSKALLTFQGGVDYIVWKLERHSGTAIPVPPRIRRYPLLFGWSLLWRLYRRGVFR
jgi:hypothetical protein